MLLRFEDRNSMAFSVESRVPFLTPRLVDFVLSLPESYLLAEDGTSKAVFRRAMRGLVPDAVLDRRDKIGFATPEESWLVALRPWIRDVLASDAAARARPLRLDALRRSADALLDGRGRFDFRLWRWVNLIRWAQRFDVSFEG
jgi:asparagine synthase (glutamine-hydrolysing)